MNLSEWILRSREERMKHCDLSTPCVFDPRKNRGLARGICFDFLGVKNDVGNLRTAGIGVNHMCENDTDRGRCVNPLHLMIGTKSENSLDRSAFAAGAGGRAAKGRKNTWTERETFVKGAKTTASQRWKSLIDGHIAPPGPLAGRIRKQLGLKKGEKFDFKEHAVRLNPSTPRPDDA